MCGHCFCTYTLCVCVCVCVCSNMLDLQTNTHTHLTLAIHTCSKDILDIMWMSSIITCLLLPSLCLFPSSNIKLNGSTGEGKDSVAGEICSQRVLQRAYLASLLMFSLLVAPCISLCALITHSCDCRTFHTPHRYALCRYWLCLAR